MMGDFIGIVPISLELKLNMHNCLVKMTNIEVSNRFNS